MEENSIKILKKLFIKNNLLFVPPYKNKNNSLPAISAQFEWAN